MRSKIKTGLLVFTILGFSSCAYKTCPTYAKKDMKKQELVKKTPNERV